MLPRIIKLRSPRKRVFLVATNHIENFDGAIARPGRFDLVVPVMPPTVEAKLNEWKSVEVAMTRLGLHGDASTRVNIERLTYDEMEAIVEPLTLAPTKAGFKRILADATAKGTLSQPVSKNGPTWLKLMEGEAAKIRIGA
jgi:SpoVK/Ycf46/Vps4 family AAA+-type ATPase